MNRKFLIPILMLLCAAMLSGCRCSHTWTAADCTDPERCALCGIHQGDPLGHIWDAATCDRAHTCTVCSATEGSPLGHSWIDASCEEAKICETCGKTEGEPLGHSWTAAACTTPKTCARCHLTEGTALDHHWTEATTEAPKTCTVCGATEGEAIPPAPHFPDTACRDLIGSWHCTTALTAEDLGLSGCDGVFSKHITLTFRNDGTMTAASKMDDADTLETLIAETVYNRYAAQGMTRAEADLALQGDYDKSVPEYAASLASVIIQNNLPSGGDGVYFVTDGLLHFARSRDEEATVFLFSIQNSTLTLTNTDTGEILVFIRIS